MRVNRGRGSRARRTTDSVGPVRRPILVEFLTTLAVLRVGLTPAAEDSNAVLRDAAPVCVLANGARIRRASFAPVSAGRAPSSTIARAVRDVIIHVVTRLV